MRRLPSGQLYKLLESALTAGSSAGIADRVSRVLPQVTSNALNSITNDSRQVSNALVAAVDCIAQVNHATAKHRYKVGKQDLITGPSAEQNSAIRTRT
jgi:hypothetical protein